MSQFNYIRLGSGVKFNYLKPDFSQITIEEIAHSLSLQCRYIGHTKFHYSVALHSVLCSIIAPQEYKYQALMHDSAESLVGDCPAILKNLLPDYRKIEENVEKGLWTKFGIQWPMHPEVKKVDMIMLATELKQLMPGDDWKNIPYKPANITIKELKPKKVKEMFIKSYYRYLENSPKTP